MKSIPTWAIALSLLVLCSLLVAALVLGLRAPQETTRLTAAPRASAADSPAPKLLSELNVQLELSLDALAMGIDSFVPRSFGGREEDPIAAARDDSLVWSLNVGKAELGADRGALRFRIPISDGAVTVTGRVGAKRRSKGPLGLLQKLAGFNINETIEFEGVVEGTLRPRLNADWTLNPGLRAEVTLSRAEADLFGGALRISFRDTIKARIDEEVARQAEQLTRKLASDGRLVTVVRKGWAAMHAVVPLSTEPAVWMTWQPVALAASPPTARGQTVSMTLGTTVRAGIEVTPDEPGVAVRPLPTPTTPRAGGQIQLRVPVSMQLDRFDSVPASTLGLPATIDAPEGRIDFDALSIHGTDDTLTVAVDATVQTSWLRERSFRLYVTGVPVFDRELNRLSLSQAAYDVDTRSALIGVADRLLEPWVLAEIERRSVFEILETEAQLLERARAELDLIEQTIAPYAQADLRIESGQVSDVFARDGWLVAILNVRGSASVRVDSIKAWLP